MPRWRKRKHLKGDEVPDGFEENERVTKCSLSSLCHPGVRDVRPYLEEAIEYCSQLRVLISQVAKHHIFATLKEQAGTLPLPFEPDQSYYSRVKTMIVHGEVSYPKPSYDASLQNSRNAVLMALFGSEECPPYNGQLSGTTISHIMGYMVKQLAENLATHVQTHANDCVKNWLNIQLHAQLTDDHYSGLGASPHFRQFLLRKRISSQERQLKLKKSYF